MKILFVTTGIRKSAGGIQRFNSDLIRELKELGYEVEILALKKFNGSGLIGKVLLGINLLRKFVKSDFDIIFYGHINFFLLSILGRRFSKAKYIVLAYGIEAWDIKGPLKIKFLKQAETIVSVSDFTKNKLLKALPDCREKIFILPGAVNCKEFKIKEKSDGLVKKYGLQDKKVVLTVARLPGPERCKGQDMVIKALSEIIKSAPDINIKYLIVGTGSDRPRLEQLAEKKGIKDFVIFCGFISGKELVDYYNLADVFIMPSKKEGFGIVFLEALACGIPAIAGNKDASKEPLLNGKSGLLVDPDSEDEIAQAILKILNGNVSKELLNRQYLREQVIENFGTDKFRKRLKILMHGWNE